MIWNLFVILSLLYVLVSIFVKNWKSFLIIVPVCWVLQQIGIGVGTFMIVFMIIFVTYFVVYCMTTSKNY